MIILSGTRNLAGDILYSSLGTIAGQDLTVAAGTTLDIDVDTPSIGCLTINGTVRFLDQNRNFTVGCIMINSGGVMQVGTETNPFLSKLTLTFNDPYVASTGNGTNVTNPGDDRALLVMPGGTLDIHGVPPTILWTTLNANASAAATSLTLATSTGWSNGDAVAIAITDFPNTYPSLRGDATEQFTLTSVSGAVVGLNAGIANFRWGQLQYPVDTPVAGSGMSLTQNTFSAKKAHVNVPVVLDERARVANLSRNIIFQGANDPDWTQKGFGLHIMWMGDNTVNQPLVRIDGLQVRRGGQRGALGRYPLHAHMNSYNTATGAPTADNSASYVKRCVVWESENRAYTVHGTCGMTWHDNVAYDIKGHALFLEDGSERRNSIRRNSIFKVRNPNGGSAFLPSPSYLKGTPLPGAFVSMSGNGTTTTVNWTGHGMYSGQVLSVNGSSNASYNIYRTTVVVTSPDQFTYLSSGSGAATGGTFYYGNDQIKLHDYQSSGYWITNLDNYFEDNYASDCVAGDKNETVIAGNGVWISLASQCFGKSVNVAINPNTIDTLLLKGFTCHSNYGHGMFFSNGVTDELGTADGGNKYSPNSGNFLSTDHVFWKNETGAYFNFVRTPTYQRWTVADNGQTDWRGSTDIGGLSSQHLLIGNSLNNAIIAALPATNPTSPSPADIYPRAAFFPYHGTVRFFDCTAVNYPYAKFVYASAQDKGSAGGVSDGAPDNYDVPGVEYFQGVANTNIQLINSHYGEMCPPIHLDGRTVDAVGLTRHYAIAPVWCDSDGKYGAAGKFMLPYTRDGSGNLTVVDDFFLSGAAAPVDGPLTGTVVCKTTTTRYFGAGFADAIAIDSDALQTWNGTSFAIAPFTVTRQDVVTGATIGTPYLRKANNVSNPAFGGYGTWAMQNGGRYQVDFTDGSTTLTTPTSFLYLQLSNANVLNDFVILGLPWRGTSVPRVCFGNTFDSESTTTYQGQGDAGSLMNTMATADAANQTRCTTSGGSIAAVVADTSGKTYFRDTVNNRIWVRYTSKAFTAHPATFGGLGAYYDTQFVIIKV